MNNITIGQYIPGTSWLHKMDPRIKIVLTILLVVALFIIPNSYYGLILIGSLLVLYLVLFMTTGIPLLKMLKGLKPVLFLLVFTFVLQILGNKTGNLLYTFHFEIGLFPLITIILLGVVFFLTSKFSLSKMLHFFLFLFLAFLIQNKDFIHLIHFDSFLNLYSFKEYNVNIYDSGLLSAGFIFIRIIFMIAITSLLTFSTMSTDINNGLYSLLTPLKYIKVPIGTISMMLSLTLRFVPTLMNETNKIMKAQASRGVDFNEGNFKQKVNQIISLLIPMFVISFKKAEDLANAMEARGYIIDAPRTRIDELKLHFRDYFALFICALLLAGVIVARIYL